MNIYSHALRCGAACVVFFLFVADSSGQLLFHVDSTRSGVTIRAKLSTLIGSDSNSDSVGVSGTLQASVNPQTLQITNARLTFADSLRLKFEFGSVISLGSITAVANPSTMLLELTSPGPPTALEDGAFSQVDNEMALRGILYLTGEGSIASVVPSEPQNIDVPSPMILAGTLGVEEGAYEIVLAVDFRGSFDLDDRTTADVVLDGVIYARGASPIARDGFEVPRTVTSGIYPSPAFRSARLVLSLDRVERVQVELYDVQGRRAALLHDAVLPIGRHEIWFDVSQLGSGAYVVRLQGESIREAIPVFVVK